MTKKIPAKIRCVICAPSAGSAPLHEPNSQPGSDEQARPAPLELTYAPAHIATNAPAAVITSNAKRPLCGRAGPGRGWSVATIASAVSVPRNSIATPQWSTTDQGLLATATVAAPRATWMMKIAPSAIRIGVTPAIVRRACQPVTSAPNSKMPSSSATIRCDHSRTTPPSRTGTDGAVAERPVGAGHARAVDPDPTAKDGQREGRDDGSKREPAEHPSERTL